jgi:hypothetical protein
MKTNALKCFMLFPLHDNHGEPFEQEVWDWWRVNLTLAITGFTETGEVKGWWQGQSDFNRSLYAIITDPERLTGIRSFLQAAGKKMGQEKMYFEYHDTYYDEIDTA